MSQKTLKSCEIISKCCRIRNVCDSNLKWFSLIHTNNWIHETTGIDWACTIRTFRRNACVLSHFGVKGCLIACEQPVAIAKMLRRIMMLVYSFDKSSIISWVFSWICAYCCIKHRAPLGSTIESRTNKFFNKNYYFFSQTQ